MATFGGRLVIFFITFYLFKTIIHIFTANCRLSKSFWSQYSQQITRNLAWYSLRNFAQFCFSCSSLVIETPLVISFFLYIYIFFNLYLQTNSLHNFECQMKTVMQINRARSHCTALSDIGKKTSIRCSSVTIKNKYDKYTLYRADTSIWKFPCFIQIDSNLDILSWDKV